MIRVDKPEKPPEVLARRGAEETGRNRERFNANPDAYRDGSMVFDFKSAIYGHESVKEALKAAQNDKCCFCEARVSHIAHGDVEHFRPKAGFQQRDGDSLGRPGYYWLAYEWSNLYFSCQLCNQRFKKNLFPLRNPSRRATSHEDDHAAEKPVLLDPGKDEPEKAIGFRDEVAFPIRNSVRGRTSIELLGLNRDAIVEARKRFLEPLRIMLTTRATLRRIRELNEGARPEIDPMLAEIDAFLEGAVGPSAEYSAMARAVIGAR